MGDTLLYEVKEGVAIITFNRPDKLNSINVPFCMELCECLEETWNNKEARSVLITATGKNFCAGADLSNVEYDTTDKTKIKVKNLDIDFMVDILYRMGTISQLIHEMPKPVISSVRGAAVGGGAGFAILSDIVFASENAVFGYVFSKIGVAPDSATSVLLTRHLGLKKTMELFFSGETITSEKALEFGLINKVVQDDLLDQVAWEYALKLASGPTKAFAYMKKMVYGNLSNDFVQAIEKETVLQYKALHLEDANEGVKAFLEKRKANFTGE